MHVDHPPMRCCAFSWRTQWGETQFLPRQKFHTPLAATAPSGNTLPQQSIPAENNIKRHGCPSAKTFLQLSFNEKHNDKLKEKQFAEKQFTTQKRTASVEETRELKSCRGMWRVRENHIKWLVMSVFLPGPGNAHLAAAAHPAFGKQGAKVTHFTQALHFTTTKGGCNPGNLF